MLGSRAPVGRARAEQQGAVRIVGQVGELAHGQREAVLPTRRGGVVRRDTAVVGQPRAQARVLRRGVGLAVLGRPGREARAVRRVHGGGTR